MRTCIPLKLIKKQWKKTIENAVSVGQAAATKVGSNVGVGTAAGTAATAAVKYTAGMSPGPRVAFVVGIAAITAAGTKVGLDPLREGTAISKNIDHR